MHRTSSNRVKEIFSEAADLPAQQRERYLDSVCRGDTQLREEVERLLAASDESGGILDASSAGEFLFPPPELANTFAPGDRVGRFSILRLIGRGGMGEVYEAEDTTFGGRLALKTLRCDSAKRHGFAARFRREIRLARQVTHPNVCRILDVGTAEGPAGEIAYLTMELLEGETLAKRLTAGPLPPSEAAPLFAQIVRGLQALHASGVIHRDLKPANLILVPSAAGLRCVITDFGLAQTLENSDLCSQSSETLTVAGQLLGTPAYMAPEQLKGADVGPASDIYALGIVMYESVCGKRPYEAVQFVRSAEEKLAGPPRRPSQVTSLDRRWDPLILRCLHVEAEHRPTSPELLKLLEALAAPDRKLHLAGPLRLRPLYRSLSYCGVAVALTAAVPLALRSLPPSVLRNACETFPGYSAFCALPADKDIAVFPFEVKGGSDSDRAIAAGAARYIRESFYRLAPEPGEMCVHLRNDRIAESVNLVLGGEVEVGAEALTVRGSVREARPAPGSTTALTLRRFEIRVARAAAGNLHHDALEAIAAALDLAYKTPIQKAWFDARPKSSESFLSYLEGLGYLESGKYELAAQQFNAAINPASEFDFAPAHVGLGDAYRLLRNKTGDRAWSLRASQAYERALSLEKAEGFAGARKRLGELELGFGEPSKAVEQLSAAHRLWADDHLLVKALASAHEATGRPDRAEEVLKDAVQRAPNCWLTHNTLADFYARHARFSESERSMLQIIRATPNNATAYHNLSLIYLRAGRLDDAIQTASRSIALRPVALTYSTLGRALLFRGCHADGLLNLQKAVDLDPAYFAVWANLAEGLAVARPGSEEAVKATRHTLELSTEWIEREPGYPYARAQRAIQWARLGEAQKASEEARKALQLAPGSHDIILSVAGALELAGQRAEAIEVLARGFEAGLSVYELNSMQSLDGLRKDSRFVSMLKRFKLDHVPDPGGLTPPVSHSCPASDQPGHGLKESGK